MDTDTIKSLLKKQAGIAGLSSNLQHEYSGHTMLCSDLQLIEINADESMKILNKELEEGKMNLNPATLIAFAQMLVKIVGKEKIDELLNEMESKYKEGSWKDHGMETLAGILRKALEVPDSNPDN